MDNTLISFKSEVIKQEQDLTKEQVHHSLFRLTNSMSGSTTSKLAEVNLQTSELNAKLSTKK
jgi:hypothetical protein